MNENYCLTASTLHYNINSNQKKKKKKGREGEGATKKKKRRWHIMKEASGDDCLRWSGD